MKELVAFLIFLILIINKSSAVNIKETKLVKVFVVQRSGAKAPNLVYPKYESEKYWDKYQGLKYETSRGLSAQYEFGKHIRKIYHKRIEFSREKTRASCKITDFHMQSASAFLAGVVKPYGHLKWNEELNWLPLPIHPYPITLDDLIEKNQCPRYFEAHSEVQYSNGYQKALDEYTNLIDYIGKHTGWKHITYEKIKEFGDILECDSAEDLEFDNWIEKDLKNIRNAYDKYLELNTYYSTPIAKLNAGNTLLAIKAFLTDPTSSINFQSHTTDQEELGSVISLLKSPKKPMPHLFFSSALIFELRADNKKNHYVNIGFKNNMPHKPIEIVPFEINGCDQICPIEVLENLVIDYNELSIDKLCVK